MRRKPDPSPEPEYDDPFMFGDDQIPMAPYSDLISALPAKCKAPEAPLGLLVDFENIQSMDLSLLPAIVRVTVFVGHAQKSIPFELVQAAQKLGSRMSWIKAEGSGRNALDFHIAYYLGNRFATSPKAQYFILSKDTGFDPLVLHLTQQGLRCKRITDILEVKSALAPPVDASYSRVIELLSKSAKLSRPRKRSTLEKHISSMLQKKIKAPEIKALVDQMVADGKITEANDALTYFF